VKVLSNLAMSLDGKIATADRRPFPLGTARDRELMRRLRLRADAIVMGGSTLRTFRKPFLASGSGPHPWNVILSRSLEGISPRLPFFRSRSIRRILLVTGPVSRARLAAFEHTSEVIRLPGRKGRAGQEALAALKRLGASTVIIEGGGGVMWEFVRANLIDEYRVTLTPRILGGDRAPTLVDGEGFPPARSLNLRLKSCRRNGDELFLIYARTSHGRR
jgi:riboflavin-specific deaminase-like protein